MKAKNPSPNVEIFCDAALEEVADEGESLVFPYFPPMKGSGIAIYIKYYFFIFI